MLLSAHLPSALTHLASRQALKFSTCGAYDSGTGREEGVKQRCSSGHRGGHLRRLKSFSLCHIPVPASCPWRPEPPHYITGSVTTPHSHTLRQEHTGLVPSSVLSIKWLLSAAAGPLCWIHARSFYSRIFHGSEVVLLHQSLQQPQSSHSHHGGFKY